MYVSPTPTVITKLMHEKLIDRNYTSEQIESMTPAEAWALLEKKYNDSCLLDAALGYAKRGWAVFPLRPHDKRPITKNGWEDATTDVEQIKVWWTKWPKANIGVATLPSKLILFDPDVKNGQRGPEVWKDLQEEHGFTDAGAFEQTTPSGGKHIIYAIPEGVDPYSITDNQPFSDIDVKTKGYFVAEPSTTVVGDYVWDVGLHPLDGHKPTPLPNVLLRLLQDKQNESKQQGSDPLPNKIPQGQRNTFLTSLAGSIRRRDVSTEAILAALEVVNKKRCDPPLSQTELEKIATSIARYEPEDPFIPSPPVDIQARKVTVKEIKTAFVRAETGDAELLAKMYGGAIVYDHGQKRWYRWQEHWWTEDRTQLIRRLVSGPVAAQYYRVAGVILKGLTGKMDGEQEKAIRDKAKEYGKRANSLRFKHKIDNVLSLATSIPELALTGDEWDKDPWLLGVGNGVIDLRTGKIRDGAPEDYIRTYTPTEWQPEANAPRWGAFLQEIFDDDADLIDFMQRLLGYGITGQQKEHKLPILWGAGRNGKDTMLKAIKNALGAHARAVSTKILLSSRRDASPGSATPYLCDLQGLRLCWAGETRESAWLNASQIKSMTGGGDQTGRPLYGNPITFSPSHLLLLMTNNKPHTNADDFALWQRLLLIPFNSIFVKNPKDGEHLADTNLDEKLKKEAAGILCWLVKGCLLWQAQGLNPPQTVLAATEEYRSEEDVFGLFLSESCYLAPDVEEKSSVLYKQYKNWVDDYKLKPMSITAFGRRMGKKFEKKSKVDGQWYHGIALRTTESMPV